ncbi:hypothetical protein BMS3Abin07_01224 [bacterium BMS3Abin07]|nr:hypothetical protein BMS3Abin07_01224 [bacterium BMS3Abin07]GBE31547.1 hypothetical protein BMS3Bbin05_00449 [bacterium BMS3Bbin05]HDZ88808.1 DUF3368 domain-containing protein [Nitrospirota bacterium]
MNKSNRSMSGRFAKTMRVPVAGALGVLITAKLKGTIPELAPLLNALKKHRFYIADEVFKKALILVHEK